MISAKEIMQDMVEGGEYVNALMPREVYNQINDDIQHQMSITVRVKNSHYTDDEVYRDLTNKASKASKKVRDYEFNINNK